MLQADNALSSAYTTSAPLVLLLNPRRQAMRCERDQTRFIRRSIIWWKLPVTAVEDDWARSVGVHEVVQSMEEAQEEKGEDEGRRRREGSAIPASLSHPCIRNPHPQPPTHLTPAQREERRGTHR